MSLVGGPRGRPSLSVVIPVYNSSAVLKKCLDGLAQSHPDDAPDECIVVNDGSTDDSAEVARAAGCTVIATAARSGPAYARNLGAHKATGDIILFLDADVRPHPDTLARVRATFAQSPDVDAVMGSYDDSPGSSDFLSQYRNLMHCFVHHTSRREASTFWSGCGAIRRDVFLAHHGFDESYRRPAIEDIELGYRMQQAGRRLLLDRDIQVQHLKRWTFWGLVSTDVLDRGIPWTELILRDQNMPDDLNLQLSQRVSVVLVFLLLGLCAAAAWMWGNLFVLPLLALLVFSLGAYWVEGVASRRGRIAAVILTAVISILAWRSNMPALVPPLWIAQIVLFLRHRYKLKQSRWPRRINTLLLVAAGAAGIWAEVNYLPDHRLVVSAVAILLLLVILNNRFYVFLAARRGRMFALAAIPFHLLYHFYNGLSFAAGSIRYWWRRTQS